MQASTINVGIVGLGPIAEDHAAAIHATEEMALVACTDIELAKAEWWAQRHGGGCRAFTSFDDMLADPAGTLDAVVVAVPDEFHKELAIAAMERHMSVMVENSPAMNLDEASAMVAVSEDMQLPLLASFPVLYANPVLEGQTARVEGLGRRFAGTAIWDRRTEDPFWNRGPANPFHDQSHHLAALVGQILGYPRPLRLLAAQSDNVGRAYATSAGLLGGAGGRSGAPNPALFVGVDYSSVSVTFDDGSQWTIRSSVLGHHDREEAVLVEVSGARGTLTVWPGGTGSGGTTEGQRPKLVHRHFGNPATTIIDVPSLPRHDALQLQAEHWRDVIRGGVTPRFGGPEILWLMQIARLRQLSVEHHGREVEL
jgi:predicted dehydrogenase